MIERFVLSASRLLHFVCIISFLQIHGGGQPNPPIWPSNVKVYDPTMIATIQSDMDAAYTTNGNGSGQTWNGAPSTNGGANPTPTNNVFPQAQWNDNGQFNTNRYAFLFKPGNYTGLNVYVGYYTSVMGLGTDPTQTTIDYISCFMGNGNADTPICPAGLSGHANLLTGALNTFWRSLENFTTNPNTAGNVWWPTANPGMTWAVSQSCPIRKVKINGNLYLFQLLAHPGLPLPYNYSSASASGGFIADCVINGIDTSNSAVTMGSQQQFFVRNSNVTSAGSKPPFSNGVWNQVFVGTIGAPASNCGNCPGQTNSPKCPLTNCNGCLPSCTQGDTGNPYTTIQATPIIAEKPYIVFGHLPGKFELAIPPAENNKIGTSLDNPAVVPTYVDFVNVYVATANDTAATINAQIALGNHIILTPGIYNLTDTININQQGLVLLGIGFPTLISTTGKPCILVSAQNVRVGGVLLQAGPSTPATPTLLQWGTTRTDGQNGFLYDCFTRTGRFQNNPVEPSNPATLMVHIISNSVVCDNLWLWRADHDTQGLVKNQNNYCKTAFLVDGDHVTAYGLAGEHTLGDITMWNGNYGECYFYQAEFPYDAQLGFNATGYRVGASVTNHKGWGVGVYSFFRDFNITVPDGIHVNNPVPGIQFTNALTRYLGGNGGITSVLNGLGVNTNLPTPAVNINTPGPAYLCDFIGTTGGIIYRPEIRARHILP